MLVLAARPAPRLHGDSPGSDLGCAKALVKTDSDTTPAETANLYFIERVPFLKILEKLPADCQAGRTVPCCCRGDVAVQAPSVATSRRHGAITIQTFLCSVVRRRARRPLFKQSSSTSTFHEVFVMRNAQSPILLSASRAL